MCQRLCVEYVDDLHGFTTFGMLSSMTELVKSFYNFFRNWKSRDATGAEHGVGGMQREHSFGYRVHHTCTVLNGGADDRWKAAT